MGGLTGALNIAKNALLTFQIATQVISHNIANVNNESYCRQKVVETTYPPSPSPVGNIGTGVKIETIKRYFDMFLERNINLKKTDYGMFSAEETGMTILESLFNETQESGLSKILRDFWDAWQNLANYPENLAARTQVIEDGKLIAEALKQKFQGMKDLQDQIGLKLQTIVDKINDLASQIAELNSQIVAQEAGGKPANDLRDQRDKLVSELSQLANIQYFETKDGAYNIILGKGLNLVNLNYSWKLEISGTDVYWVGSNGEKVPITSKTVSSGELGGWLKLLEQLSDEYNYEYVSGNKVVYDKHGQYLSESDKLVDDVGLSVGDTITFSGTDHFGNKISGSFTVSSDSTVRDFLDAIENAYSYTVKAYIKDGRLYVEDQFRGPGKLSFTINSAPPQLDFGSFDDPAFQRRVTELNLAGKLKLFGEQLIKAVNELHTQGVGITFYTKELEGDYSVNKYIKEFPYYLDLKRDGFFYIWVKDPSGKVTPVKVQLNLSENATLDDLTNQINAALSKAGFDTGPNYQIRAINREGHLVFQAADGYSFGFSNDTSGILLSTGINLFFVGTDPADFTVNPALVNAPELIASGKMDVNSYRSEIPLFGTFASNTAITDAEKNYNLQIDQFYVRCYDQKGNPITNPPVPLYEGTYTGDTLQGDLKIQIRDASGNVLNTITVSAGTKIEDIPKILDGSQGITAELDPNTNILILRMDPAKAGDGAVYFTVDTGTSGVNDLIYWDQNNSRYVINYDPTNDTLQDLVNRINRLPFLRAYFDADGKLVMRLEPDQTTVYGFELGEHFIGTDPTDPSQSFLTFLKDHHMVIPSFRWDGTQELRYLSGLEPILKPTVYSGDSSITPSSTVSYTVKFYDANGNLISQASVAAPTTTGTLQELVSNFDAVAGLKANIQGDKFYIWLDPTEAGAPANAAYFTIEANDDGSWGLIKTSTGGSQGLKAGEIDAYLFDSKGDPIDAWDTEDGVTDPFRINLYTDKNLFQIFSDINSPDNREYGLSASLDRQGKLIVSTTGLYQTSTFILQNQRVVLPSEGATASGTTEIVPERIDPSNNTYYYMSDLSVDPSASFAPQTLTLTLYKPDGTSTSTTISWTTPQTLSNVLNQLNSIDLDGDGTPDLSASIDDSGKLIIKINDTDFNNFKIESSLSFDTDDNFVSYLYTHLEQQQDKAHGLINTLSGYGINKGDNRTAQAIADVATETRDELNHSNLENYYASMVGEVGVATKAVKDSKSFLDDLLRQLKMIKDSISGVSLDEEMTDLIKYQQAFIATSKVLVTVEEMFQALINAKT